LIVTDAVLPVGSTLQVTVELVGAAGRPAQVAAMMGTPVPMVLLVAEPVTA
jgi:hypothetical protein